MIPMHYIVYVDSLFFLNFIMNLYLLILVDRSLLCRAGTWRLILGAAVGAVCFLVPLWAGVPVFVKLAAGILAGTAGMLCITFPVRSLKMFLKLLERLLLYSFGMGGALLFLIRCLPGNRAFLTGTMGLLGAGGIFFLLFRRFHGGSDPEHSLCRAVLVRRGKRLTVTALVDSGNTLIEPVSGKSVSIVDREVFDRLWGEEREFFRVIPYHSIGKAKGILQGYLLPELLLEMEGMVLRFTEVYIAVSNEEISGTENAEGESVNMIINPGLFSEGRTGSRKKRQNERRNDSESNDTGQASIQDDPQG